MTYNVKVMTYIVKVIRTAFKYSFNGVCDQVNMITCILNVMTYDVKMMTCLVKMMTYCF